MEDRETLCTFCPLVRHPSTPAKGDKEDKGDEYDPLAPRRAPAGASLCFPRVPRVASSSPLLCCGWGKLRAVAAPRRTGRSGLTGHSFSLKRDQRESFRS